MKKCFVITLSIIALCVHAQSDSLLREKKFDSLMTLGDQFFSNCDRDSATLYYNGTHDFRTAGNIAKQALIAEHFALMGEPEWCMSSKFEETIRKADAAFAEKNYLKAKPLYQRALAMKPGEQYPKDKILMCDDAFEHDAQMSWKWDVAIKTADSLFTIKDFTGAKSWYDRASAMHPAEEYPKQQIEKCDQGCSNYKLRLEYTNAIARGDSLFNMQYYSPAKREYQLASGMFSSEPYPIRRAAECDSFMKYVAPDSPYQMWMASGNSAFKSTEYALAITHYRKALECKPGDKLALDKIEECEKALNGK